MIPKAICCFRLKGVTLASLELQTLGTVTVYVIEALHPDGWRQQGTARVEYWACQEAQARCCSDGRNYRIIDAGTNRIVALIDTSSCRIAPLVNH